MTIIPRLMVETFEIYNYASNATTDDIGAMPAPEKSKLHKKGEVKGRITPGDTLEPDILGNPKDYDADVSSMWIAFFDNPVGFLIAVGDIVINKSDSTRKFQVQFVDTYPGGIQHHVECRLQTTEVWRR